MGSWWFKELLQAGCHPAETSLQAQYQSVDEPCYRLSVTWLSLVSTLGFTQSSTKSSCCPQHRAAGRSCLEPAQQPMPLLSGSQSCQLLQTPGNHLCVLHCLGLPPILICAPRGAPGKDSGVIHALPPFSWELSRAPPPAPPGPHPPPLAGRSVSAWPSGFPVRCCV